MPEYIYINHKVKKGETLWGIAKQYGVEEHKIIQVNPGIKITPKGKGKYEIANLKEGQILRIPQEKKTEKRGVKTIIGNTSPKAGIKEKYRVSEWYPGTPSEMKNPAQVKWAAYYKEKGNYTLKLKKETGEFTFHEQAIGKDIKIVGYLYSPELDNDSALPVKVISNKTPSITSLTLYDVKKEKPLPRNAKLKLGQALYVVANTTNSVGKKVHFNLLKKEEKEGETEYMTIAEITEKVSSKGTATTAFLLNDFKLLISPQKKHYYRVNAQLEGADTTYVFDSGVEVEKENPKQQPKKEDRKKEEGIIYKGTALLKEGWSKLKEEYKKMTTSEEPQIQKVSLYIPENKTKVSYGEILKLKIEGKHLKDQSVEYTVYEDDGPLKDELDSGIIQMRGDVQELDIQLTKEMYKKGGTSWLELADGKHEIYVDVKLKGKILAKSTGIIEVDTTTMKPETIPGNSPQMEGESEKMPEKENCGEKYCIKKGDKSELIREINIRLAGFGGNVPTNEFTDRTEKMIKQFQRDYMKVPETGKICGNVLKAIDEFQAKYSIKFDEIKCKCGKCTGFGNGKFSEQKQNSNIAESARKYEYPGIHRSLVWALRALNFYMSKTNLGYSLNCISSGYRCWVDNDKNGRGTTNHMGKALDLHFNKNGVRTQQINDMEIIRDKIIIPYMGGQLRWGNANKFSLEPTRKAHKKEFIATTWIHYDVRQFELKYLKNEFFSSSLSSLNGKTIVNLAKELGFTNTCNCLGTTNAQKKEEKDEVCYDCDLKFRKVAPIILEHEGGYVNDPDDSGGATNKGITIGTWRAYAKEDLGVEPTLENLKKITNEQATKIYRKRYWEPKGFCKINDDKVGLMIYDWTITSGGAGKEIQKLLVNEFEQSIVIDGDIGTNTINAINNVQDQEKLLNRVAEIRKQYYRNLAYDKKGKPTKNIKFLNGWLNRVDKCLNYNL